MGIVQTDPAKSQEPKYTHTAIIIKIDGKKRTIPLTNLAEDDYVADLQQAVAQAKVPTLVLLKSLLDWPDDQRLTALDFLASLDGDVEYRAANDTPIGDDLFEAVVAIMVGTADLTRYSRSKSAALETAVLVYPDALEGACDRIVTRLKDLGVKGVNRRDMLRDARAIKHALHQPAEHNDQVAQQFVSEAIEDAPVGDDVVVPAGWIVSPAGIGRAGGEIMIRTMIVITGRQLDVNDGTELLAIAWRRDGTWHSRTVERAAVAGTRTVVDELAPYGVDATSNNSRELIQYLFDFEAANINHLPVTKISRQLGWQGADGVDGFLWGTTLISADSPGDGLNAAAEPAIRFRGLDKGDDQIADAFYGKGDLAGWLAAIEPLGDYLMARLGLYVAFVPPLLPVFGSPNFAVDYAGRTTLGKTTCLRVGGSVWGNPDEQSPDSVIKTWDGTAVWRERVPAVSTNLPFYLDETKHARPEEVAGTIYQLVQGRSRGRGSVKGVASQDTWRTVLGTTGEQPLTSFTEDGGTRARVLALWGSPFGGSDPQTGHMVRQINEGVCAHFGHAGPLFVRFLIDYRELWGDWREEYRAELEKFQAWAEETENPFAGRMAANFAAIATAAWLAHQALDLPWSYDDPIEPLWDALVQEAGEADRSVAALTHVMDWAAAHQGEFSGRAFGDRQPHGGWAGRWDKGPPSMNEEVNTATWKWIAFIPARLHAILHDGGFEPESTIREWASKGWLLTSGSAGAKRRQYKTRVGAEMRSVWTVAISRNAIETIWQED